MVSSRSCLCKSATLFGRMEQLLTLLGELRGYLAGKNLERSNGALLSCKLQPRPSPAARRGYMALSELHDCSKQNLWFKLGDGCDSLVMSGTGTSAAVNCVWSGRNDACLVVCCERRCASTGCEHGEVCEKKQSCRRNENHANDHLSQMTT